MRRRRLAGVALGLASAALLAACGAESGPPTLTWYINPDDGGQAEFAKECTEQSGGKYRIETSLLPRDASSQREQLARRLAAEDSSIDIMSLDPPFIPELSEPGFLAKVPEDLQDTDGIVKGAVESATWKDELVTVPFWANTQLLWYRKSVAEDAGLDMSKPVTWDQLIDAATDQDKLLGVQGQKGESLSVWLNALIASAGGKIIDNPDASADDLKLGLDTDAGRAAAKVLSTIGSKGLGGSGLPTADENASMNLFATDNGSFMVNWPFIYPALTESNPDVVEDMGWAVYPRMSEGEDAAPPVGGINLGVGAFSEHPDLAWDAIKCIVTPEHQVTYFVEGGNPATLTEVYDDPKVKDQFPMAETIRDSLELAAPRPQTPYYSDVSLALQETWYPIADINADKTPKSSANFILAVLRGERLL